MTGPTRAVALSEAAMGGAYARAGFGADVDLAAAVPGVGAAEAAFGEDHGRAVLSVARASARLGTVGDRNGTVTVRLAGATVSLPVAEARRPYAEAIPSRMQLAATAED